MCITAGSWAGIDGGRGGHAHTVPGEVSAAGWGVPSAELPASRFSPVVTPTSQGSSPQESRWGGS